MKFCSIGSFLGRSDAANIACSSDDTAHLAVSSYSTFRHFNLGDAHAMASETLCNDVKLQLEPPQIAQGSNGQDGSRPNHRTELSERLHRLWTQRGDFSKFSTKDLVAVDDGDLGNGRETLGLQGPSKIGWGPGGEVAAVEAAQKQSAGAKAAKDGSDQTPTVDTTPMTMEEFVTLKGEMMSKLQ